MAWAWVYLAVSVVGAVLVVNAFRPARHPLLAVPSFFAGWYTAELPLWHVAWQVAATVAFALEGALRSWPGWVALGVNAASWTGLVVHARVSTAPRCLSASRAGDPARRRRRPPSAARDTMRRFPGSVSAPTRCSLGTGATSITGETACERSASTSSGRRARTTTQAPVLVYIHGGAWVIGDKARTGPPSPGRAGPAGLGDGHDQLPPKPTGHVARPHRGLQEGRGVGAQHIAEYGGDPGFIAVSGGSAGGHLSALLALTPGDPAFQPGFEDGDASVDACVPFYGVYDMTAGTWHVTLRQGPAHVARAPGVQAPPGR